MAIDNYGNDSVFDWMNQKAAKKSSGKREGRKSYVQRDAEKRATNEAAQIERHAKQQAEGEWVSPFTPEEQAAWHSIENDFWWT